MWYINEHFTGQVKLVVGLRSNKVVAESTEDEAFSGSVMGSGSVSLKLAFKNDPLRFGLLLGFCHILLEPKVSTKALLSINGCQIITMQEYERTLPMLTCCWCYSP